MIGKHAGTRLGTGRDAGLWPVLLVLLTAVVVPTACVLWFMSQAVANERLAVRQRLIDVYRGRLAEARDRIDGLWRSRLERILSPSGTAAPGQVFERLVRAQAADSAIVLDLAGNVAYPVQPAGDDSFLNLPAWHEAQQMELALDQLAPAADAYAHIAADATDNNVAANAWLACARCLAKSGRSAEAMEILTGKLSAPTFNASHDSQGRLIRPNALLMALELSRSASQTATATARAAASRRGDASLQSFPALAKSLYAQVSDYSDLQLPSSQRLFLMGELQRIWPQCPSLPTLQSEQVAQEYLWQDVAPATASLKSAGPGKWLHLRPAGTNVVAIFDAKATLAEMAELAQSLTPRSEARIALLGPDAAPADFKDAFLRVPAEGVLAGWEYAVFLVGEDPFAAASQKQVLAYFWTGGLGVVAIAAIALLLAAYMRRQVRLAKLKNDLVATVSHELKTPLASMRVLIDTLAEGRCTQEQQVREYYALIVRENQRLSRLIDNFLSFSRMERNKKTFEREPVDIGQVVSDAVEAVRERFGPGQILEADVTPNLPKVLCDRDALTTVLVNLLDNAYKYTGQDKHVIVRAFAEPADVCIQVSDNGIGMTRRAIGKIFDRFYQVDQTLARKAGGCGLGLSIVKYMVDAHGGRVSVESQSGKGSTFTVRLPAMTAQGQEARA